MQPGVQGGGMWGRVFEAERRAQTEHRGWRKQACLETAGRLVCPGMGEVRETGQEVS